MNYMFDEPRDVGIKIDSMGPKRFSRVGSVGLVVLRDFGRVEKMRGAFGWCVYLVICLFSRTKE